MHLQYLDDFSDSLKDSLSYVFIELISFQWRKGVPASEAL